MPAEAIHLSALADSLPACGKKGAAVLADPALLAAARLGALFVDLPYFDRFAWAVLRYVLHLHPQGSLWGDRLHHQAPIALGRALGEASVRLRRKPETAQAGSLLEALSLGYISHAAVDTSMHPMVNATAATRARALADSPARQHQEVEKFQSILFHERRFGFDFMGTRELARYIEIDAAAGSLLLGEREHAPVAKEVAAAMHQVLGAAPTEHDFARFLAGYRRYVWLIASPIGKTIAPPAEKEREKPALFDALDFPGRYHRAVAQSVRFLNTLSDYLCDGVFDESARAAFHRQIPEGSIDPGGAIDAAQSPGGSDTGALDGAAQ